MCSSKECYIMPDMLHYSCATPLSYGPAQQLSYLDPVQPQFRSEGNVKPKKRQRDKNSSTPYGIAGAAVGGVAGGIIGAKRNPYMKNGVPTDTFAKKVYDRYMKIAPEEEKNAYNQFNEVIKNIDKVKDTDELKTLLNNNPKASADIASALTNTTAEEYLSSVSNTNLAENKTAIKKRLEHANELRFKNLKNEITNSGVWDATKKKFIKPDSMPEEKFKAIKKTARRMKAGCIAKWATISAALVGVGAVVAHKLIQHKKQTPQQ